MAPMILIEELQWHGQTKKKKCKNKEKSICCYGHCEIIINYLELIKFNLNQFFGDLIATRQVNHKSSWLNWWDRPRWCLNGRRLSTRFVFHIFFAMLFIHHNWERDFLLHDHKMRCYIEQHWSSTSSSSTTGATVYQLYTSLGVMRVMFEWNISDNANNDSSFGARMDAICVLLWSI